MTPFLMAIMPLFFVCAPSSCLEKLFSRPYATNNLILMFVAVTNMFNRPQIDV